MLAEAKKPLNTKETVEHMLARGLWQTKGRTPAAAICAALLRHIQSSGNDSRFRRAKQNRFSLGQ